MKHKIMILVLLLGLFSCNSLIGTQQRQEVNKLKETTESISSESDTIGNELETIALLAKDNPEIIAAVQEAQEANAAIKEHTESQLQGLEQVLENTKVLEKKLKARENELKKIKFWAFLIGIALGIVMFVAGFFISKFFD